MIRRLSVICSVALLAVPIFAQTAPVTPPPATNGTLLADTAKSIEEKMVGQGPIEWEFTSSNLQGISTLTDYRVTESQLDTATCNLTTKETTNYLITPSPGITYSEGGKPVTGDKLRRKEISVSVTPLKQVFSIKVEDAEEAIKRYANSPHFTMNVTPQIFLVILSTSGKNNQFHREINRGKEAPRTWDELRERNHFTFLEKERADGVAQLFRHAVELCGGEIKAPIESSHTPSEVTK